MVDDSLTPVFEDEAGITAPSLARLDAGEAQPATAYQLVHDEVQLDGNARLNLATFVTTWMDEHAERLYSETVDKNMVDKDEYPSTAAVEVKCTSILAHLWNAPDAGHTIGTSTTGSSEACMLAGLAFKRLWQHRRRAEGKDVSRPNLVMSSAVQVCWEKFCNYWDVEMRLVPISREHKVLDGHDLEKYVDENTIGVVTIMGVTYTGMYEPVRRIAMKLDEIQRDTGFDVPIHVDGASGAMIAPFLQPTIEWDFRIDRVHSISTSGHKYGGVYPGLGWVVWREKKWLPEDLIFHVSYLGGNMPTFALNFSRPGAQVLLQYYLFLRLGVAGYTTMQQGAQDVAVYLSREIGRLGPFELWNDGTDIPVFAWSMKRGHTTDWNLYHLAERLRMSGWIVPAYAMPAHLEDLTVQRIVVRNDLSIDMARKFMETFKTEVAYLESLKSPMPAAAGQPGFHH